MIASVSRYRGGSLLEFDDDDVSVTDCVESLDWGRGAVASDPSSFTWIRVPDPLPDEVMAIGKQLGLSDLQMEDCLNPRQRPKVEIEGGRVFMLLKELRLGDRPEEVETGQRPGTSRRQLLQPRGRQDQWPPGLSGWLARSAPIHHPDS